MNKSRQLLDLIEADIKYKGCTITSDKTGWGFTAYDKNGSQITSGPVKTFTSAAEAKKAITDYLKDLK